MTKEEYGRDENAAPAKDTTLSRVGDIVFSPLATPRAGTLVCDGSAVSRQTYKELFDFLGVSCGEGDGETTFNLPDLRDVWILCAGTEHEAGDSVAEGLPEIMGSLVFRDNNVDRSGTTNKANVVAPMGNGVFNSNSNPDTGFENMLMLQNTPDTPSATEISFAASRSSSIYGASTHVTPASVAVLPCIVYE